MRYAAKYAVRSLRRRSWRACRRTPTRSKFERSCRRWCASSCDRIGLLHSRVCMLFIYSQVNREGCLPSLQELAAEAEGSAREARETAAGDAPGQTGDEDPAAQLFGAPRQGDAQQSSRSFGARTRSSRPRSAVSRTSSSYGSR